VVGREVFKTQLDRLPRVDGGFLDRRSIRHASGKGRDQHYLATFGLRNQIDLIRVSLSQSAHGLIMPYCSPPFRIFGRSAKNAGCKRRAYTTKTEN
jgi:hypothetical protein